MKKLAAALLVSIFFPAVLPAQQSSIKSGYAVVTPLSAAPGRFTVSQTIGLKLASGSMQASFVPTDLAMSATLLINASERLARDTGIAFVNPWNTTARITLTVRRETGISVLGPKTIFLAPRQQTARFLSEIFADQPVIVREVTGMMTITSNVAVGMMALRFRGAVFSTEPVTRFDPLTPIPFLVPGVGGNNGFILPQFAVGGGWATEIAIANLDTALMRFRVDVFAQDGSPMVVSLNGKSGSTFFDLLVHPGGVLTIAPRDSNGDSQF